MAYTVVKMDGRWVHVVRFARDVAFSDEQNWFMICFDWEKVLHFCCKNTTQVVLKNS
jgi:hypothetical protein